jgi:hypothetical protein
MVHGSAVDVGCIMDAEFLEYDGSGNRFDWILEETKRVRNVRQHHVTRGLMIKNLARAEDRLLWAAEDKKVDDAKPKGGRVLGSKNKPKVNE